MPFPFADSAVSPLTIINHSYEYNMQSSLGSSESLSLGVFLGTLSEGP